MTNTTQPSSFSEYMVGAPAAGPTTVETETDPGWGDYLGAGIDSMQAQFQRTGALTAESMGFGDAADRWRLAAKANEDEAARVAYESQYGDSGWQQLGNLKDPEWWQSTIGQAIPTSSPFLAGAAAGGIAGSAAAGPVGALIGAILGGGAAAFSQELGSAHDEFLEANPGDEEGAVDYAFMKAGLTGAINGASVAVAPLKLAATPLKQAVFQSMIQSSIGTGDAIAGNAMVQTHVDPNQALSQGAAAAFVGEAAFEAPATVAAARHWRKSADRLLQEAATLRRNGNEPEAELRENLARKKRMEEMGEPDSASRVDTARQRAAEQGGDELDQELAAAEAMEASIKAGGKVRSRNTSASRYDDTLAEIDAMLAEEMDTGEADSLAQEQAAAETLMEQDRWAEMDPEAAFDRAEQNYERQMEDQYDVNMPDPGKPDPKHDEDVSQISNIGSGIADGLYDTLWKKVEAGDTKENGQDSVTLQVAKKVRDAGGLTSKDEFRRMAGELASSIEGKNGSEYQGAARAIVDKYTPPAAGKPVDVDGDKVDPDTGEVLTPKTETPQNINSAADEAATSPTNDLPEPTQAQKEAGNYKKGHIKVHGLDIAVENPKGSTRSGTSPDGKEWSNTMSHHYGYIKRTTGADGDAVDVFVNANADPESSGTVFVVDQTNGNGEFDEHKALLGFSSEAEAVEAYKAHYDKGWEVGPVTPMAADEFKQWAREGDTTKPLNPVEQRDQEQRAVYDRRIEDMDEKGLRAYVEELRTEILTDERTGLGSNKSWRTRTPKKFVASVDLDSLKFVNDNMGHGAGDKMIAMVGDALRQAGVADDSYHISGDEFYVEADNALALRKALAQAQAWLSEQTVEGDAGNLRGPSFSYGIDKDLNSAEAKLQQDKQTRERTGQRAARGERPPGFNAVSGRDDAGRSESSRGETAEDKPAKSRTRKNQKVTAKEKASREWLGADKGDKVVFSKDVGYAKAGTEYTIDSIGRDGSINITSGKGSTAISPGERLAATRKGVTVEKKNTETAYRRGEESGNQGEIREAIELFAKAATIDVEVVGKDGLPDGVKADMRSRGIDSTKGVYHNGRVYIVAEAHSDANDALATYLHEVVGHAGVRAVLGDQFTPVVRQIFGNQRLQTQLQSVADRYGLDMNNEADHAEIADEFLASIAEKGVHQSLWSRVVAMVRRALRKLGLAESWTDNDIKDLLMRGYEAMHGRAKSPEAGGTRYRKDEGTNDDTTGRSGGVLSGGRQDPYADLYEEALSVEQKSRGRGSPSSETFSRLADGEEVLLFHRSEKPFERFDNDRVGSNTETDSAALGHWLSVSDDLDPGRYGSHVSQWSVRLDKPYRLTVEQFDALGQKSPEVVAAVKADLERRGFDGLVIEELEWASVFDANSIRKPRTPRYRLDDAARAATESNPTGEAAIRYRLDAVADAVRNANGAQGLKEAAADIGSKNIPRFLGLIPRRYLSDFAKNMPSVDAYIRSAQAMDARRGHLHNEAAEKVDRVVDYVRKNKEAAADLFDLEHAATLAGYDPAVEGEYKPLTFKMPTPKGKTISLTDAQAVAKAVKEINAYIKRHKGGRSEALMASTKDLKNRWVQEQARRAAAPDLDSKFSSLSEEAQAIYREMRDAYKEHHRSIQEALDERLQALQEANEREAAQAKEEGRPANKSGGEVIAQLRKNLESQQVAEPYFPLSRFGEYWAAAKDGTGNVVAFSRFESRSEQREWRRNMEADGNTTDGGRKMESSDVVGQIDPTFASKVTKMVTDVGGDKAKGLADEIWQMYLNSLPDLSMRKHAMHRKKRAGFAKDALRGYAHSLFHGAHQLARLEYTHELEAHLHELKDEARSAEVHENDDWAAPMYNEMLQRHDWAMNPKVSEWATQATQLGFLWYLGATPAAALVNMTQTFMVGLPILGARFGWGKAASAISKNGMTLPGQMEKKLTGDRLDAYKRLMDAGVIDKTQAHDLAGISEHGGEYTGMRHRVMEKISWVFHKAELWNREVTAMAAYDLAREKGLDHEAAIQASADATWDSHFDYSNANRPRFMQNNFAKVALLFKQHSLNMTYRLARDFRDSFKGETPEVRKQARAQLTGILMMTGIFAGAAGMPMVWAIEAVLNSVWGDEDEPFDAMVEFRAYLAEQYGKDVADLIVKGAADKVTGLSISSRVSLNSLWIRDPSMDLDGREYWQHLSGELLGPVFKIGESAMEGAKRIGEGQTARGVEGMLPKFAKDLMKGLRYMSEGATNMRGDAIKEDFASGEILGQILGFTPADLSLQYEQNNAVKKYERRILERRSLLLNRYWLAQRFRDGDLLREVRGEIRAYNKANRRFSLTADTIRRSMRRRLSVSRESIHGVTVNPNLRYLTKELNFSE